MYTMTEPADLLLIYYWTERACSNGPVNNFWLTECSGNISLWLLKQSVTKTSVTNVRKQNNQMGTIFGFYLVPCENT